MAKEYSTYDAKARFSEILRRVREGQTVRITYHGRPVAEIRPLALETESLAERLQRLEGRGAIQGGGPSGGSWKSLARRPGALRRFLEERAQ
ncbi:MAG: type II toxin-antitoxin system prevent-host-death family antitoxin [Gemmatimonadota bacterium]|nr:MAG: type II toxin-antitoxin system prevent-host-death family antitoxin [Gemmatimonadota bacterium]